MDELEVGNTRRDLLKKAAVGGAILWAVPAVISSPAFAASGRCGGSVKCSKFYGASVETNSSTGLSTVKSSLGIGQCVNRTVDSMLCPSPAVYNPTPTLLNGAALVSIVNGTTTSVCFKLAAGAVPIFMDFHFGGQDCSEYTYNETTKSFSGASSCGPTVTVSGSVGSGLIICVTKGTGAIGCGLSGLNIYFCN